MSHFIGLCFGEAWESNLDSYYEGLEVDEYIAYTKEDAIDMVKQSHADNYEYALKMLTKEDLSSEARLKFENIVEDGLFISYEKAWEEVKEWGYKMDEYENLLSTYNPNSKWDWYEEGGRWNGFIRLKERDENGDPLRVNQALFKEIDWEYMLKNNCIPFNYITEEGDWYEKGEMGWWGMTANEKEKDVWNKEFESYLKLVDDDCLVTAVDFHI